MAAKNFKLGDIIMTIVIHSSLEESKYFFSSDHCQKFDELFKHSHDTFVPVSYQLPQEVKPRPGLEDGIIKTVGDLIFVYHRFEKEIKNPDKKYQVFER